MNQDTIVAVATAPGQGGIGVIRLSGQHARDIGCRITETDLQARHAHYCQFRNRDKDLLDSGIALFFPSPHSFTGEDVVELQAHGGPVILDLLVQETCKLGARQAEPGEFSLRAYLNNKIDLTQAEAIADLINSSTEQAALNASRSMQGAFSKTISALESKVMQLRVFVEAAIDFPEEEIDFIKDSKVGEQLQDILQSLEAAQSEATRGCLLREGMTLVIAGRPNAGKSSLLNALSGQDRAIVTAEAGTTRDLLQEHIQIDGMPLHIVDTAGLRLSEDEIEQEGIRRARGAMATADRILLVVDTTSKSEREADYQTIVEETGEALPANVPVTIVRNKIDMADEESRLNNSAERPEVYLSAKTGAGIDLLQQHLKVCMGYQSDIEGGFSARRRHLEALERARVFLVDGQRQLLNAGAGELLAEDLRHCHSSLGEITGIVSSDDLLGEIFSGFCIGK
ncbi:MAG: tRNA uridine-5-carboxymethylaminomethyl(34) synthesis GTPase MnmE [Halioglobus sp.]|nr:tRNA uridine-5-carboxymethylaminomethyl(34) synthesis GTPase MnmE [Halioglobus sp.]